MRQVQHLSAETLTTEFYSLASDLGILKHQAEVDEVMENLAVDVMITAVTIELNHGADIFNTFADMLDDNQFCAFIHLQSTRLHNTFSTLLKSVLKWTGTLNGSIVTKMLEEMYS